MSVCTFFGHRDTSIEICPKLKETIINLIEKNIDDVEVDIIDSESSVEISVSKEYKGIYNIIYDNEIKITYIGNKETKKIIKGW